ncbi:unnamed protein product, partial [Adineta steineri]
VRSLLRQNSRRALRAGLYKANSTYACQYDGEDNACEHIEFHLCIREQNHGRIFINSAFQVF